MSPAGFYDQPTEHQVAAQEQLARSALERWDLGAIERIDLLAERENVVFDVHAASGRVVVRVHRAGYHDDAELSSQREWRRALRASGIVDTPEWVLTADGEPFVVAEAPGVPEPRQVSVLEFVDGDQLTERLEPATASETCAWFQDLGALMARLHVHSSTWERPAGFRCIRWDVEGLLGDRPLWGSFWELEHLPAADRALMADFRERARHELTAIGEASDVFGLVHNDFLPENLLVGPSGLCLLDFDDCGDSWFLFDISTALVTVVVRDDYPSIRHAFFAGYREVRSLDDTELERMALFFAVRMATYASWLDSRRHTQFARELGPIIIDAAVDVCRRYLAGELDA
jgi:Ser/Thr protein kinase RdoA (MazF antagonist)